MRGRGVLVAVTNIVEVAEGEGSMVGVIVPTADETGLAVLSIAVGTQLVRNMNKSKEARIRL